MSWYDTPLRIGIIITVAYYVGKQIRKSFTKEKVINEKPVYRTIPKDVQNAMDTIYKWEQFKTEEQNKKA